MKTLIVIFLGLTVFSGCSALRSSLFGEQERGEASRGDNTGPGTPEDREVLPNDVIPDSVSSVPKGLGLVFWAGLPDVSDEFFRRGMDFFFREGFQTFKLVVAPQAHATYKFDSGCDPNREDFLDCFVSSGPMEKVLAHPRLLIANLVVFDPLTAGPRGDEKKFLNVDFLNRNRAEVVKVYENLAYKLATRYSSSGKTFLVSDWEGDNAIYCGSAYSFLTNSEFNNPFDPTQKVFFRNWCLSEYSRIYGGNARTPDEAMSGYRLWHSLRIEGIEKGRRRAAEYGAKNVFVKASLEFVAINMLKPMNFPSVLERVGLPLEFDSLSYSSYESINNGTLAADLDALKLVLGSKRIGISEFGFSEGSAFGAGAPERMKEVTLEIIRRLESGDLEFATAWQAVEDGAAHEYGLYRRSLERNRLGGALWSAIKDHSEVARRILVERAGGGCSGCDCGWALGERMPQAPYLRIDIHDESWVLRSQIEASNTVRGSDRAVSLVIPMDLQGLFRDAGLRFTVRDSRFPDSSYAVGPLVRCQ